MTKADDYAGLVAERQSCRQCGGLTNPADVEDGRFDATAIGPWSQWQGNLEASVMVVGQDWGDTDYFVRNAGFDGPRNPTNLTLAELLATVGIGIGEPGASSGQHVAFFTNAILCLKKGGLQATVRGEWFRNCSGYLRRQIEIVRPAVIVGLGERAFRSVLASYDVAARSFREEVDDAEGTLLPCGSRAFAVYHCGARIRNTHRSLDAQRKDWARFSRFIPSG